MKMPKKKKKAVVPRLRFPEFRDAGEWAVKRLGIIAKVIRGSSPRPISQFLTKEDDGFNWLKIGDISNESKYVYSTEQKIEKSGASKTREVYPGDLILSNSMSFGRPYIMGIRACIHDGWLALTDLKYGLSSEFLYYFMLSDHSQRRLHDAAAGGGVRNLNVDIVKFLSIATPISSKEQQKIADCLASLDDLIRAGEAQLVALKDHKKGLMQQLFPREGETTPRLRFPEFRDAGEWEVKRLGDICDVLQGYGFPESLQGKQQGKYPFCKVSDISNAVSNAGGHVKQAVNYVDDEEVKKLTAKPIPKGSTIFAKIGEALRLNKRAFVDAECLIDNNVVGIKERNSQATDYFVFHLSQKIDLNKYCGGAVPSVNKATLQSIKVIVPRLPEQQKIADCLTSLDDLIRAREAQLVALKDHKKGLMHQLFPQEVG